MRMNQVAPDVWQVPGAAMRMAGGVYMPLASVVMRLADRSLLVYSPVAFSDEQAAAIDAQGPVKHLVGPNLYHHLHLRAAADRWPGAAVHGAPGLAAKRSNLTFDNELGSASLDPNVDVEVIGGAPRINEAVLFHRPSGTLVCADFLFNVTEPANLRTRFALAMMGVGGKQLMQSRLWKLLARDRSAARASIDRLLGWPIATIAPVHGPAVSMSAATLAPKLSRSYGGRVATALPA
jgi:hypothetical protein